MDATRFTGLLVSHILKLQLTNNTVTGNMNLGILLT